MTGVLGEWKCSAVESVAAWDVGMKVPLSRMPLACAGYRLRYILCIDGSCLTWSFSWMWPEDGLQLGY